jgi:toxin ParE1/3/4
MSRYLIDPLALDDIESIYRYIAADNPRAAIRVVDRFYSLFEVLSTQPETGELRNDLASNVRAFPAAIILCSSVPPRMA